MPIKKSAKLFIVLAVSAVGLLVMPSGKMKPVATQVTSGRQTTETELFLPWSIVSQSILRSKA